MEYCRLQVGCLVIVLYIAFTYYSECRRTEKKHVWVWFDTLLVISLVSLTFDGITAYTVNHLDTVAGWFNGLAHLLFLVSVDGLIFTMFLYILKITEGFPKSRKMKGLIYIPFVINILVVIANIGNLEYRQSKITNYSMGVSAYTCFIMVAIYILFTLVLFVRRWNYIERHKRVSILAYLLVLTGATIYQMVVPEALLTSISFTVIMICMYFNLENPAIKEISRYHNEMVMGFATLVEKRDDNTGGHIRRTSLYVELLAKELRDRGHYKSVLTKDYIKNLMMAAPMHDIGKISVPDAILQKPAKLTDEEFEIMKSHAENGGRIIRETFGNLEESQYMEMAYRVATFHHEKWNGKGYPRGLKDKEIPLCARIMAIADVFDAISEKRCYRDAMPMDTCFEIIKEGSGRDFEPLLVEIFLDIRDKVETVHNSVKNHKN